MRRISPIIKGESKKVQTTDVKKVSYYVRDHNPAMTPEDSEDYNSNSQYLVSDNGKFIAKYNKEVNAVGFYEESGVNIKHLTHTTPERLEGTVFTIEEYTEIDLINDVLPQGDILIKTSYEVLTIENDSVLGFIEDRIDDLDDVEEIIYTGLSKGKTENVIVDVMLNKYINLDDIEIEDDTLCKNCDCIDYCTITGEEI